MERQDQEKFLQRASKIEKQVLRWDLYAKLAPTFFLVSCFILLSLGIVGFETLFFIGMALFAITAVVWWFWTIFSIRFLIRMLSRATKNLVEVSTELSDVRKEFFNNDKDSSS